MPRNYFRKMKDKKILILVLAIFVVLVVFALIPFLSKAYLSILLKHGCKGVITYGKTIDILVSEIVGVCTIIPGIISLKIAYDKKISDEKFLYDKYKSQIKPNLVIGTNVDKDKNKILEITNVGKNNALGIGIDSIEHYNILKSNETYVFKLNEENIFTSNYINGYPEKIILTFSDIDNNNIETEHKLFSNCKLYEQIKFDYRDKK